VEADFLNALKNRFDKYWTNQDVVYDYKSDLTGTGGLRATGPTTHSDDSVGARLVSSDARWRLSSSSPVVVCNTPRWASRVSSR